MSPQRFGLLAFAGSSKSLLRLAMSIKHIQGDLARLTEGVSLEYE